MGKALLVTGALLFAGAVAWWYVFYEQFLGIDVKRASECFYYTTDICALAAMAEPMSSVPPYSPVLFWVSVALIAAGALTLALSPLRR